MSKIFGAALGILTAIGGFVDIGDLVTNAVVGSRFGLSLVWVVVVGVIGISLFAHMSGKVTALSGRATFDIIRERLGPRAALANLTGSMAMTLLTLMAEIGGVALALQLLSGVVPVAYVLPVALLLWLVLWRVKFSILENVAGLMGLLLVAFIVALFQLGPDWGELGRQVVQQTPDTGENGLTYAFYAVALFGAAMTPYEVFFFSSGAAEDHWTKQDLWLSRLNVLIGFPLGGLLSIAIAGCAAVVLLPAGIGVSSLSQVVAPVGVALGVAGLVVVLVGVLAATAGAAIETALSCVYSIAQFAGWPWGKRLRPSQAPQFHAVLLGVIVIGCLVMLSGIDPIMVTEFSVVFSAVALPLTYFPILVVANDPQYVGENTNGPLLNLVAMIYLVIVMVAALAAIPLMILTNMGA
ncbi:MAG TPA: Nramp family divalent metal transporter [Aeromicrobium sp.]|nr:Nramp family divalent metal transporter [Aeromicrobium sp.]